jgi:hypothetical protein
MNFEQLASEMTAVAEIEPMDMVARVLQGRPPDKKFCRCFEYEGYDLRVLFTHDKFSDGKIVRHLSIGSNGTNLKVPERIVEEIAPHFFEGDYNEMPEQFRTGIHISGTVRQFVEITNG